MPLKKRQPPESQPAKVNRNLFSDEDKKPKQAQIPLEKSYNVRFCDISKLRGSLLHCWPADEWRCQPTFIIHSGFMMKMGEFNSAYKKRFFVLTSRQELRYYKVARDSDIKQIAAKDFLRKGAKQYERGVINLKEFKSIDVRGKMTDFRLRSKDSLGRDFSFKCGTSLECKVWILIIRATCVGKKDPWKFVDGEHPHDPELTKRSPESNVSNVARNDDFKLDDISPIMPEIVDADYKGPGYDPIAPSAPEVIADCANDEIAPSAPPAYEDVVCPGAPEKLQIEGMQTGM